MGAPAETDISRGLRGPRCTLAPGHTAPAARPGAAQGKSRPPRYDVFARTPALLASPISQAPGRGFTKRGLREAGFSPYVFEVLKDFIFFRPRTCVPFPAFSL